ncbi:MAG TPA: alpha/beta fold hydrolase [Ktedonobacterales bacterium]|jgi:3-oxoadipate enol-lactonase|nr:alpha/beta fold hydrolase [Ktedonobacterales bacterium]
MRANIAGIEIGYDEAGAGERTLVLLHAFPLNRQQWRGQLDDLPARAHLRVIAPDLRGFGESAFETGPATIEQWAGDVLALLDTLHVERFVLAGASMGGYVAFELLRRAPRRVERVILIDTRATPDTAEGRQAREETARFVEQNDATALFDREAPKLFSHMTQQERPEIVTAARRIAGLNTPIGLAAAARGLGLRPDSTGDLPAIACPALVLVGEQDTIAPVADARLLFERIPDARMEILTDAGHLANLEQPERFNRVVAEWLTN